MADESSLKTYYIPENVLKSKLLMGFPKRNWVEGLLEAAVAALLVNMIPFVIKVKIIVLIVLCGTIIAGNLIGVKNRSIIQVIVAFFKYQKNRKEYHLGSVTNYERKKRAVQTQSDQNLSAAEKAYHYVKGKFAVYIEEASGTAEKTSAGKDDNTI